MHPAWIIVIILLVFAFVGVPGIVVNHGYHYYPSGLLVLVVAVIVVLVLTKRL